MNVCGIGYFSNMFVALDIFSSSSIFVFIYEM